jgi:uncharacterized membrane protein
MDTIIKILLVAIIIMSLAGMVDSAYAVTLHYDDDSDSFCNVSETVNCDIVNTSKYSEIFGVPVAGIGFAGYLLYAVLAVYLLAGITYRNLAVPALLLASVFGVVFSLVLTYIEFFILEAVCILCVVSQVLVIGILLASVGVAVGLRRNAANSA